MGEAPNTNIFFMPVLVLEASYMAKIKIVANIFNKKLSITLKQQ
jgi:hypothetical protein